jgi:outer membrane protein TolC
MELLAAERAVEVAAQSQRIAARSVAQAAEAHRIVERKYDGGLATVAELLDAQATDLSVRLAEAKSRYDLILALGTLVRVRGADLAPLAAALDASAVNPE